MDVKRTARRCRAGSGFSLLEVLVAVVILLVGVVGVFTLLPQAVGGNAAARYDTTATVISEHLMERLRTHAFDASGTYSDTDDAGTPFTVSLAAGGAALTPDGDIDYGQAASAVPAGYRWVYVSGAGVAYDVRWNVTGSAYRQLTLASKPLGGTRAGILLVPATLRLVVTN